MKKAGPFVIIVVAVAAVAGLAFFQEDLGNFFTLRMWDQGAPGKTVGTFLSAGRDGNPAGANAVIDADTFKPLEEEGKQVGYRISTPAGNQDFRFAELAPSGEPKATRTEFQTNGGAALVLMPNAAGKNVKYRLKMRQGSWHIIEILGEVP
jgi:hypothetical protein